MNNTITYKDIFWCSDERTMYAALSYMKSEFEGKLDDLIYTKVYKETGGEPDSLSSRNDVFYILNKKPIPLGEHESLVHQNLVKYLEDQKQKGAYVKVRYDEDEKVWKKSHNENLIEYDDVFGEFPTEKRIFISSMMIAPVSEDTIYASIFNQTAKIKNPIPKGFNNPEISVSDFEKLVHQNLIKYLKDQEANGVDVRVEYDPETENWKKK